MKHVYNTDQIAHLWAHKQQSEARNAQGNFYFERDVIYSYGSHFPIARHFEVKGKRCILFTLGSHSVTTARHINRVRRAIPGGVKVFDVNEVGTGYADLKVLPKYTLCDFAKRITEQAEHTVQPRIRQSTKDERFGKLVALVNEANEFSAFVGSRKRFKLPASLDDIKASVTKRAEQIERKRRADEKKAAIARAERQRLAVIENAETMERWRNGEAVPYWKLTHDIPTMLRVKGETVETSRGAEFPLSHAKRGLDFVRAVVASGKGYSRNGHTVHLGNYAIDSIDPDGTVHAGCHVVSFDEIERIAPLLDKA